MKFIQFCFHSHNIIIIWCIITWFICRYFSRFLHYNWDNGMSSQCQWNNTNVQQITMKQKPFFLSVSLFIYIYIQTHKQTHTQTDACTHPHVYCIVYWPLELINLFQRYVGTWMVLLPQCKYMGSKLSLTLLQQLTVLGHQQTQYWLINRHVFFQIFFQ